MALVCIIHLVDPAAFQFLKRAIVTLTFNLALKSLCPSFVITYKYLHIKIEV